MGVWGWMGSHEVVGKGYVFTKNRKMTSIGAIYFHFHMSRKAAKSMAKLISQSCGDLQLAVYLPRKDGPFKGHPSTHGCQSPDKLEKGQRESRPCNFQQY